MRLEQHDRASTTRANLGSGQRSSNLGGMMTVVIDHHDAVYFTAQLETALRSCEAGQRLCDLFEGNFQLETYCDCCQRVVDVVHARHAQLYFTYNMSTSPNSKSRSELAIVLHVMGRYVRLSAQAVRDASSFNQWNDCLHVWIVKTKHRGPIERNLVHEVLETRAHIFHVVVVVHVLAIDIRNDGNRGRKHQKRAIAFVGFNNHQVALSKMRI